MFNRYRRSFSLIALLVLGLLLLAGTPAGRAPLSRTPAANSAMRKLTRPTHLSVRKQPAGIFTGSGSA